MIEQSFWKVVVHGRGEGVDVVAMMVVVEMQKVCLLMMCMCCSRQTPLMRLSIKEGWSLT